MQNGWTTTKLGDHIQTLKGYAFKSQWYSDNGVPLVKVSDFTGDGIDTTRLMRVPNEIAVNYSKYELRTDDVVIQTVGSWPTNPQSVVGKVIRVPRKANGALLNQNAVKIIPDESIDKKFLFYALRSSSFKNYIIGCAQGAASQASITLDAIRKYDFSFPKLGHQRRIAALLSAYDDLIENNTRRIQILEEMAQLIYEEWFVRFRFPGHQTVRMVESELSLIPEGWKLKRLGEVLELVYGKALKADEREEGNVPVYGSSGIVGFHSVPLVDEAGIIVGRKGNVGSVHLSDVPFYPIDTVYYVKTELPLSYVFFNLKRQNFINNDAAVPGLNRNQARSLPFILPADNLVNKFDALVQNLFGLSRNLQTKNGNLRRTRDLLLPKLISGEIDVSNFPEPVSH